MGGRNEPIDPEYDELSDDDEEEDQLEDDDPTVFKIRNPIPKNIAQNLTTRDLHGQYYILVPHNLVTDNAP